MLRLTATLALAASALAGCAVGPDYKRPDLEQPRSVPEAAAATESGIKITTAPPLDRWWTVFRDAPLDRLVEGAREGNQDLKAAVARVREARALAGEAFAPLLPQVAAEGDYTYYQTSRKANPTSPLAGQPLQLFQGTGQVGYEVDLWGRVRRGLEAAEADEAAFEQDRRAIEITVVADTAQAYFDLGEAEAALAIAREGLDVRQKTLDLVKVRFDAGIAQELELRRAEGEVKAAAADVPEAERQREVAGHRLAILIGRPPDLQLAGKAPAAFDLPPEVPIGIPSTLLERRPDVRAAESRLVAANARIGAAYADFFPRVTIAGQAGYASLGIETIVGPQSTLWSIGPSIRIPIFEGGATYARWQAAQARTDEATAQYRQTILRAFADVADALSGIAGHVARRDRLAEEVTAETRAVELATEDYKSGLTTYLNVLDSQRTLLAAKQLLVQAQRDVLLDIVQLQRALGGGWTETTG